MDPVPSINRAYSLPLQEERQRSLHDVPFPNSEQIALSTVNTAPKPKDRTSHKTQNGKKPFYHCDYCGMDGHFESRCFKKHGYPPKENRSNDQGKFVAAIAANESSSTAPNFTNEQYNQLLALINSGNSTPLVNLAGSTCLSSFLTKESWIIDSGATDHMASSPQLLTSFIEKFNFPPIKLPTGQTTQISHIGSAIPTTSVPVIDVFVVPAFNFNLLSVSKITKALNCSVTFFLDYCIFQDLHTKKEIGLGKENGGLYHLMVEPVPIASVLTHKNESYLWHWRLGHPSPSLSRFILSIPSHTLSSNKNQCNVCPLAKHCCLLFQLSTISTKSCFDLIHCDVWGPYNVPALCGSKSFLTIVDDFSRCTLVLLMKSKAETSLHLKNFFAMLKTQFSTNIRAVRNDNVREFFNHEINMFFKNYGVIHQHSCVDTPQ